MAEIFSGSDVSVCAVMSFLFLTFWRSDNHDDKAGSVCVEHA